MGLVGESRMLGPGLVLGSRSSVLRMTKAHKKPFRNRNHLRYRVHSVELQRYRPQFV